MTRLAITIGILVVLGLIITRFVGCKHNEPEPVIIIPVQPVPQPPPLVIHGFAIIAGSSVISSGATVVDGDLGLSPGTEFMGFPPGIVWGRTHINDPEAIQAKLDLNTQYNDLESRTSTDVVMLSGNIGGLTLTPGLYKSASSLEISSNNLTFDAQGNPDAIFIIQIATTLTTTSSRRSILEGGAQAKNIYWQVGSSASFGSKSIFKGNVVTVGSLSFGVGATLDGSIATRTGPITFSGNTITKRQ